MAGIAHPQGGMMYYSRTPSAKWCKQTCVCQVCGNPFPSPHKARGFCSPDCLRARAPVVYRYICPDGRSYVGSVSDSRNRFKTSTSPTTIGRWRRSSTITSTIFGRCARAPTTGRISVPTRKSNCAAHDEAWLFARSVAAAGDAVEVKASLNGAEITSLTGRWKKVRF
jgi:hypothetical protein